MKLGILPQFFIPNVRGFYSWQVDLTVKNIPCSKNKVRNESWGILYCSNVGININ